MDVGCERVCIGAVHVCSVKRFVRMYVGPRTRLCRLRERSLALALASSSSVLSPRLTDSSCNAPKPSSAMASGFELVGSLSHPAMAVPKRPKLSFHAPYATRSTVLSAKHMADGEKRSTRTRRAAPRDVRGVSRHSPPFQVHATPLSAARPLVPASCISASFGPNQHSRGSRPQALSLIRTSADASGHGLLARRSGLAWFAGDPPGDVSCPPARPSVRTHVALLRVEPERACRAKHVLYGGWNTRQRPPASCTPSQRPAAWRSVFRESTCRARLARALWPGEGRAHATPSVV